MHIWTFTHQSASTHASRRQVATLLAEYFSGGDLGEAAAELADMGEPELQHFLVKRAVTAALDKHNREREMTSVLLSSLYSEARISAAALTGNHTGRLPTPEPLRLPLHEMLV